ncbi:MAG TPA: NAD-dependent epimerase/dehydratase family protein [Burkholderiales bacterium]|nr:NAD-dependent epimerase/dehydratase family protein [Burkholderiales bacterium]
MNERAEALPQRFKDADDLEDFMTAPTPELEADLARVEGDLMVLGVGGKMGPTLARMAKRAVPGKRVIGVARFSEKGLKEKLEAQGIECIACDLLERSALERLPRAQNIVFMAGHKFGAAGNPAFTWAMNTGAPLMVAETFRESRIVCFSTICVYPYADTTGPGAGEETPAEPPAGDYANSCVGREQMFLYGSHRWRTAGRLVRLSYSIDMRYGVLHDVASNVLNGRPVDVTMGYVNVIWQGDANAQALRLLAHCTSPTSPLNVTGPDKISVRWLAQEFGRRLGKAPKLTGSEAPTAWIVDTSAAQRLLGRPRVPLDKMIDWVADWVAHGGTSLGKATHFQTRDGKY